MKDSEYIKEFWAEKEKETGSKLVITSYAELMNDFEHTSGPVKGLLYLMENGFYFENFESNNFINSMFLKKQEFKKINIHIPPESILRVYDFSEAGTQKNKSFFTRMYGILFPPPDILHVSYVNSENTEKTLLFKTLKKPSLICEKYNKPGEAE